MRRAAFAVVALAVLVSPMTTEAQQWSPAQEEVWKVVSEMNDRFYSGDIDGLYEFIDPNVVWWNTGSDVPGDYQGAKKLDTLIASHGRKWLYGTCTPQTIQAFDLFAVVNMFCRGLLEAEAGQDPESRTMRGHLVMKREGSSWMLVSNFFDLTQR